MSILAPQPVAGTSSQLPRILLITHSLPYPPVSGDQQRTWFLHRALSSCGSVDVLLQQTLPARFLGQVGEHCNVVAMVEPLPRGAHGRFRRVRRLVPAFVDRVATTFGDRTVDYSPDPSVAGVCHELLASTRYDLIVGRYIRPTAIAIADAHRTPPILTDVDDVDFLRYQRWAARREIGPLTRLIVRRHLRQVRRLLPPLIQRWAHLWVASPRDLGLLDHPSVSVLPNLPYPAALSDLEALPPAPDASRVILFVGVASNRANVEGLRRFIRRVWPQVRREEPRATLRVVGSGGWKAKLGRLAAAPGLEVRGFVADLPSVYRDAAFTVVPLYEGAGTKIKVLESLSYGRTVVAATPAIRGFEHVLCHWESLVVAECDDELSDQCIRLLRQPQRRNAMAETGRRRVATQFSFDLFQDAVAQAVERVLGASRTSGPHLVM